MLEVSSISSGYDGVPVLFDVSLKIEKGEAIGLVGANGAGKSTLVRTICGLLKPTHGKVEKDGLDLTSIPAHKLPQLGLAVVLENRRLFGELTVHENLLLGARGGKDKSSSQFSSAMKDIFNLFPVVKDKINSRVNLLSGGEQQMVAVARALMLKPDILILDEPSTGLAPKIVQDMMTAFNIMRSRGLSMLVVEQNVSIAAELTDRGYVMSLGNIVAEIPNGGWETFMKDGTLIRAYLGGRSPA